MLDKPLTKRQTRLLRVKAKQHNAVCKIMQREHSPHKSIVAYITDILGCYREVQRDLRSAEDTLSLLDQLRQDDDHEDMTLDEYVSTLFAKIKRLDALKNENTTLKEALRVKNTGYAYETPEMKALRHKHIEDSERALTEEMLHQQQYERSIKDRHRAFRDEYTRLEHEALTQLLNTESVRP